MNLKKYLMIAVWSISAFLLQAQDAATLTFNLKDADTDMPIAHAAFTYGNQNGSSAENGEISFTIQGETTMYLSHVNYGSWTLTAEKLREAGKQGVVFRKSLSVNLYPITVIGLRDKSIAPDKTVAIAYTQRMEHDATNILTELPAFNAIRKSGNYGFDPVFRGFKYDQLNLVINGAQSATAACPNRMDPPSSQMAPNMMERIEVLKGPYALRFGTGFGATINFIPMPLRFSEKPDFYGRVSSAFESNGSIARGETQLGYSGAKYDASVFGSWSQGGDYTDGNGAIVPAGFSRGSFGTNLGFKLSKRQQLRISATYNRARDADFATLPMDLRKDDTWLFNVRHDIWFTDAKLQNWNTTVYGSFVNHLMDNLLKNLDPRMMNASTLATTYNYGARSEGTWQLNNKTKFYLGIDYRTEGASGTREREFLMGSMAGMIAKDNVWQDGYVSKTGLFAEYQRKGNFFNYVASARLVYNTSDVNDAATEFAQNYANTQVDDINPSFSLGLTKPLGKHNELGVWLGRAQRSAGLTERYINYFPVGQDPYELLGNPLLAPEVNNQADLTYTFKKEKVNVRIDVFAAYMQDFITSRIDTSLVPRLPASPGVRRFVNINNAFKTGFEVAYTQVLFAGLQHQLNLAYTYAQDLERDEPLPEIAPLDVRYTLMGSYLGDKLKPQITVRAVATQSRISPEFGETETPGFALLDAKIAYQLSKNWHLTAGVNNLLNQAYYEHLNRSVSSTVFPIFAPGTNIFAKVSVML